VGQLNTSKVRVGNITRVNPIIWIRPLFNVILEINSVVANPSVLSLFYGCRRTQDRQMEGVYLPNLNTNNISQEVTNNGYYDHKT
jgi:hypothetical protein